MNATKLIGLGLGLALLAQPAAAAGTRTMVGLNVRTTCSDWLHGRLTRSAHAYYLEAWALGYLSGASSENKDLDLLDGMNTDSTLALIDEYCREGGPKKELLYVLGRARDHGYVVGHADPK